MTDRAQQENTISKTRPLKLGMMFSLEEAKETICSNDMKLKNDDCHKCSFDVALTFHCRAEPIAFALETGEQCSALAT